MTSILVPYRQRTLESFADDVITTSHRGESGRYWYAKLDVGPQKQVSDPDFSQCAESEEEARAKCARTIRDDARGIGKYAPHSILVDGLQSRLLKHWVQKEIEMRTSAHHHGTAGANPLDPSVDIP